MTWLLVLIWLLFGLVAGALAHAARWGFAARGLAAPYALQATLGLGVAAAFFGGILGWLIFGRFFALPMSLWVAVLAVSVGPWLMRSIRDRRAAARERPDASAQ